MNIENNRSKFLEKVESDAKKQDTLRQEHLKELLLDFHKSCIKLSEKGQYDNRIGLRIDTLRKLKGLTFEQLGKLAGVDKSTISRSVQKETIPTPNNFLKIVYALNVDIENFVNRPDETADWIDTEEKIAKGEFDELLDIVPMYDIDSIKNSIFLILEDRIFTYTKDGVKYTVPEKHLNLLKKQILMSFDSLDAILGKD